MPVACYLNSSSATTAKPVCTKQRKTDDERKPSKVSLPSFRIVEGNMKTILLPTHLLWCALRHSRHPRHALSFAAGCSGVGTMRSSNESNNNNTAQTVHTTRARPGLARASAVLCLKKKLSPPARQQRQSEGLAVSLPKDAGQNNL